MTDKKDKPEIRTPWQHSGRPAMLVLITKTVELLSEVNRMLLLDKALQAKNMAEHVTGVNLDESQRANRVGPGIRSKRR